MPMARAMGLLAAKENTEPRRGAENPHTAGVTREGIQIDIDPVTPITGTGYPPSPHHPSPAPHHDSANHTTDHGSVRAPGGHPVRLRAKHALLGSRIPLAPQDPDRDMGPNPRDTVPGGIPTPQDISPSFPHVILE